MPDRWGLRGHDLSNRIPYVQGDDPGCKKKKPRGERGLNHTPRGSWVGAEVFPDIHASRVRHSSP
jgi:hypothetical protein